VAWLNGYGGGDCFYASAMSVTGKTTEIEGFGTAVEPFNLLENAFKAKFHVEPDINVRLIEPSQCEVTSFLRAMSGSTAEKPTLLLDRTSVPDGAPISGTIETSGGLISNVLLIDHKGMTFDLDDRVTVQSGRGSFSIPIALGAADKAAGKAVPLVMIVITGPESIHAADFSRPKPATAALADILAEIKGKEQRFSATAKYFHLGG
jgi:serine/threonine-protein kinase